MPARVAASKQRLRQATVPIMCKSVMSVLPLSSPAPSEVQAFLASQSSPADPECDRVRSGREQAARFFVAAGLCERRAIDGDVLVLGREQQCADAPSGTVTMYVTLPLSTVQPLRCVRRNRNCAETGDERGMTVGSKTMCLKPGWRIGAKPGYGSNSHWQTAP